MPPAAALADTASSSLTYRYNESRSALKDDFSGLMVCLVRAVPTPAQHVPKRTLETYPAKLIALCCPFDN